MAATDRDRLLQISELSARQIAAVDALVSGKNDREAADQTGVHRVTVTRWRLYNPAFKALLNERRADLWDSNLDRLRGMLSRALDRLDGELDGGDWRAAVELLKLSGAASQAPFPPDLPMTPEGVLDQDAARRWQTLLRGVVDLGSHAGPPPGEQRSRMIEEYWQRGAFEER